MYRCTCTGIQRIKSREILFLLGYVFVQLVMKKIRTNTSVDNKEVQKPNEQTNEHSGTNEQTKEKKANKATDQDGG